MPGLRSSRTGRGWAGAGGALMVAPAPLRLPLTPTRRVLPIVLAIFLVTLGRAIAVYPCCLLFSWSGLRVTTRHQHVLFWGGLRGALALALALALPEEVPGRELIVTVSFAVVAFSIFVQGMTLTPLLRRFGEIPRKQ